MTRLRRVLNQLRAEGRLACTSRGRSARWVRVAEAATHDLLTHLEEPASTPLPRQQGSG